MPRFSDRSDFTDAPERARQARRAAAEPATAFYATRSQSDRYGSVAYKPVKATVIDRRRVYDPVAPVSQGALDKLSQRPTRLPQPQGTPATSQAKAKGRTPQSRLKSAQAVYGDRRLFNFTGFPKTTSGNFARTVATPRGRLQFLSATSVIPCIQRTIRRQVMFAKKKAGHGKSIRSRKRWSYTSRIGC